MGKIFVISPHTLPITPHNILQFSDGLISELYFLQVNLVFLPNQITILDLIGHFIEGSKLPLRNFPVLLVFETFVGGYSMDAKKIRISYLVDDILADGVQRRRYFALYLVEVIVNQFL